MDSASCSIQQPVECSSYRSGVLGSRLEAEKLAPSCPFDRVSFSDVDSPFFERFGFKYRHKKKKKHCSLGMVDILPLEIRNQIFLELDVASLVVIPGVNHIARRAVDALVEYRTIRAQVPELVRTILSLGIINPRPISELHAALSKRGCDYCGGVEEYLYVLTYSRVCSHCLTTRKELLPLSTSDARLGYGLDVASLSRLPSILYLTDTYPHRRLACGDNATLVDRSAAERAGIALHGSKERMTKAAKEHRHAREMIWLEEEIWQKRVQRYKSDLASQARSTQSQADLEFDADRANPYRFAAVMRIPWPDRDGIKVKSGILGRDRTTNEKVKRRENFHPPGWREIYDYAGFMEDAHARIASDEMSAVSATEGDRH